MFQPQDLVKGQDFTAFNPQTATQHNQLVDNARPYTEDPNNLDGVGLLLTTTDSDINATPVVPDPTAGGTDRWARYLWLRRPFNDPSITNTSCIVYGWNPAAINDPVLLKWQAVDPSSYTTLSAASRNITDGYVKKNQNTFTSVQANFTSSDLGKLVAGVNIPVGTTILQISSTPNTVILSANATGTTSAPNGDSYTIQYASTLPYRTVYDAILTGQTIQSNTAGFKASDVGMIVTGTNIAPNSIIQSVQSLTQATMNNLALQNGPNQTISIAYKPGSPLTAALNYAVDTANNSYATSIAANNNVATLQNVCIGGASPSTINPDLNTQIQNLGASINSSNININSVYSWVSGDLANINTSTNAGTINFRLTAAENAILALQTGQFNVAGLVPGTAGYKLRTNAAGSVVEWYDDAIQPEVIILRGTITSNVITLSSVNGSTTSPTMPNLPTGIYLVQYIQEFNAGTGTATTFTCTFLVGGISVTTMSHYGGTNSSTGFVNAMFELVKVSTAGNAAMSNVSTNATAGTQFCLCLRRLTSAQA